MNDKNICEEQVYCRCTALQCSVMIRCLVHEWCERKFKSRASEHK
jgi:hypothetical protein